MHERMERDNEFAETSLEDIRKACSGKLALVGMVNPPRPGVALFAVALEHRHYPPRNKPRNDLFQVFLMTWEDMLWEVIVIPLSDRHLAEEAAKESHMRIADGIPNMIDGAGIKAFPLAGRNIFTLETNWNTSPFKPHQHFDAVTDEIIKIKAIFAASEAGTL